MKPFRADFHSVTEMQGKYQKQQTGSKKTSPWCVLCGFSSLILANCMLCRTFYFSFPSTGFFKFTVKLGKHITKSLSLCVIKCHGFEKGNFKENVTPVISVYERRCQSFCLKQAWDRILSSESSRFLSHLLT